MTKLCRLLLVLACCYMASAQWNETETNNTTIHVSGQGSVTIEQDSVDIALAVNNQASTATEAQQMTTASANNVLTSLKTFNITNLKTESISLQPVYNYTSSPAKVIGFESGYAISYTSPPEIAGETLDVAIENGANRIDSVQVSSTEEKKNNAYKQALERATKDAESKAATVVEALGLCLQGPLMIKVESTDVPPVFPISSFAESMSADAQSTVVVPGEAKIEANIDVAFLYGPC